MLCPYDFLFQARKYIKLVLNDGAIRETKLFSFMDLPEASGGGAGILCSGVMFWRSITDHT